MSWYRTLKAMPLPVDTEYPDGFQDGRGEYIKDRFKDPISIGHGSKYVGHGVEGIAYDIGDGKVVKVTKNPAEYQRAFDIMVLQEDVGTLPCVVHIYDVEQVSEQPAFKITSEKLRILTDEEIDLFDDVSYIIRFKYNEKNEGLFEEWVGSLSPDEADMARKFYKMYSCLVNNNMPLADLHCRNVGFKADGSLALLDIGAW